MWDCRPVQSQGAMRAFLVTLMIVLLVLPAHAQRGLGKRSAGTQPSTPEEQRQKHEQQQQERAYKAASDKIPVKKPVDPWANMR